MAKGPSPLLGYNNNIRHEGKLYHIQTEDSGVGHPHIITHLFADGGRIIATRKTDYSEHLGAENQEEIVRGLMKEQHKAMAIGLRDGMYDNGQPAPGAEPPAEPPAAPELNLNEDTLERAARARMASSPMWKSVPRATPMRFAAVEASAAGQTDAGAESQQAEAPVKMKSIFGDDPSEEMSLDEVILAYIHEEPDKNE